MALHVQPKAFADALSRVMGAVERSKENPVLGHVLITNAGGVLTMRATDLHTEISTTIECEGDLPSVVTPADRLANAFSRLADRGDVQFAMDGSQLIVTSGRSRFVMPTLEPADNFPTITMNDVGCTFMVDGRSLATLFDACAFAMAANAGRQPFLEGLHVYAGTVGNGAETRLCAVGADGHMLMAREVPADLPRDMPKIVIPARSVDKLVRMVKDWAEIQVEITDRRFIAAFGSTRFTTKLYEGAYADWRQIVPVVEPSLSYDSDVLTAAIDTAYAAVQADKKHRGLKLTFTEDETEFAIRNGDGTAAGNDACSHSLLAEQMPEGALGCNPTNFLAVISHLAADTIQLGFRDFASPVLLTCPNLPDRLAVIMPMRV